MAWPRVERIGPLAAIVLLHVGLFVAMQSGLLRHAPQVALPREVVATFIIPERAPEHGGKLISPAQLPGNESKEIEEENVTGRKVR